MKVFAAYDGGKTPLVRVWSRAWESRGWTPQLLSEKEISEFGSVRKAARRRGGGMLTDLLVINFSFCPEGRTQSPVRHGHPGWEKAGLVQFSAQATEEEIMGCGRELTLCR